MTTWKWLKQTVDVLPNSLYYTEDDSFYKIKIIHDNTFLDECLINKNLDIEDREDFENNYKNKANTPRIQIRDNDGALIVRQRAFANTDNFRFRGVGFIGTALAGQTTDIDFKIQQERFLNGAIVILKNHKFEDTLTFQVVDKDNVLGFGQGIVVDQFATNWNLSEDSQIQESVHVSYPARIIAGLYVRCKYTSTGNLDVLVKCNLFLHQKDI